jgi:hypothetical protein
MFQGLVRPLVALRNASALSAAALALVVSAPAMAEPGGQIGETLAIVNIVTGNYDEDIRKLNVGDRVRQDEVIEVRADGRGELKLDDDTKLAIGPNSKLKLDKFVYDSDKNAGEIAVNLTKGAFRWATGNAAKPSYVIKTPSASIAVRGTVFDVFVLEDKSTWLLLHEGAVEVRGAKKSKCQVLDQPGRLIPISADGKVGKSIDWKKITADKAPDFDKAFPFVATPPQTTSGAVLTRAVIVDEDRADAPEQECRKIASPNKPRKAEPRVIRANLIKPVEIKTPRKVVVKEKPPVEIAKPKRVVEKAKPKRVVDEAKPKPKHEKPIRVVKRRPRSSDDGWGNGVRAMDIVIGIGIGGGFGKQRGSRGNYPRGD